MKRLLYLIPLLCVLCVGQGMWLRSSSAAAVLTPPTLVSYTQTSWDTTGYTGTSKSTASVSWNSGDILVVLMGREIASAGAVGTPTAAGLTFSFVAGNNPGTDAFTCASGVWTATAGSNGSGAITVNLVSSSQNSGFGVWVFRNSQGVGNHAEQHTATKTVSLTPIAADGAIVWGVFDFAATAITGISATPTPTDERQKVLVGGGAYTIYVEDLTDQTSAGSVSYGITGGSGTGPFSIVSLEIKHQ